MYSYMFTTFEPNDARHNIAMPYIWRLTRLFSTCIFTATDSYVTGTRSSLRHGFMIDGNEIWNSDGLQLCRRAVRRQIKVD